jgi:cytochrome P450
VTGWLPWYCHDLHLKYGDIVRIGPNELLYRSTESWKEIYGHRSGKGQLQKDPAFYTSPPGSVHSIITAGTEQHARIRRLIAHTFLEKALREQEALMKGYLDLLIRRLHESEALNKPVDMVEWLN